jgi:hypothetical protein
MLVSKQLQQTLIAIRYNIPEFIVTFLLTILIGAKL